MEEINLSSFEEIEACALEVAKRYNFNDIYTISSPGAILYRGQSDSSWQLRTTLDRKAPIRSLKDYLYLCATIQPIISAEYDMKYSHLTKKRVDAWLKKINPLTTSLIGLDYLLYLRHHGFPSPLLDWTQSLYMALGFAFFEENEVPARSVYMYIEAPTKIKHIPIGYPMIRRFGQYVRTSKRHFLQQAMYTMCYRESTSDLLFESYESIKPSVQTNDQDILVEFIIPSTDRDKILKFLFSVNITPYSIIPTEDNFMKALWIKEHEFRFKKNKNAKKNRGVRE